MSQNNQTKEKQFMAFGRFDGSVFGASAKTADGLAFSNLGTFDHAGENRDIYNIICTNRFKPIDWHI